MKEEEEENNLLWKWNCSHVWELPRGTVFSSTSSWRNLETCKLSHLWNQHHLFPIWSSWVSETGIDHMQFDQQQLWECDEWEILFLLPAKNCWEIYQAWWCHSPHLALHKPYSLLLLSLFCFPLKLSPKHTQGYLHMLQCLTCSTMFAQSSIVMSVFDVQMKFDAMQTRLTTIWAREDICFWWLQKIQTLNFIT